MGEGSTPPQSEQPGGGWLRAGWRAVRGLLGLVWAFAPEIVALIVGVFVGLVVGIAGGAGMTAALFEGGGAWGRAGPVALVLPVITFLGPVLLAVFVGAVGPPTVVLAVHALVIVARGGDKMAPKRLVVLTTAAGVFLPAIVFGLIEDSFVGGFAVGVLLAPVTGWLGLVTGAAISGVRSLLGGRTIRAWWRDADASMGVAMLTASLVAWLGIWIPFAIFFLFPAVIVALAAALALGFRLLAAGNRRGVVVAVLVVNLLHASLVLWAVAAVVFDDAG